MVSVVVAGGGVAGLAAAVSAGSLGASVTLIEQSPTLGGAKSLFPYLISGEIREEDLKPPEPDELTDKLGIAARFREKIVDINTKKKLVETERSAIIPYDSLVIATGSTSVVDQVKGLAKKNVHLMRSFDDYKKLRESVDGISTAAVQGSSPLALRVTDALVRKGTRVTLFSPPLQGYFSSTIRDFIQKRIEESGVKIIQAGVERVAGLESVEAVVASDGVVHPCDAFVMFPRSIPNTPQIEARRGGSGGIIVNHVMKTSEQGVFAAGDCAELSIRPSSSLPLRLHSASRVMGAVAGANAAGADEIARISGALSLVIFGLELCSAGITVEEAVNMGLDAREVSVSTDGRDRVFGSEPVSCSLVFDRVSAVVYGVQLAGWRAASYADFASLVTSMNLRLNDLAYLESGYLPKLSRDESPISITAKKALLTARG